MRTFLALLAGALLALGLCTTAYAKEIAAIEVCGADGCRDVTAQATNAVVDGGPPTGAPDAAAPFYRVNVTMRAGKEKFGWGNVYVPSAGVIRGDDGTWMDPMITTVEELDRLVAGSTPFPAEELGLPMPRPAPAPADGLPAVVWGLLAVGLLATLSAGATLLRRRRGLRTPPHGGAAPAG